ncbi:hypothetical protein D3C81_2072570 [compost metagenome]
MRQTTYQIAGGYLLGMLELLLTQTALVIHGRHLQQNKAIRQPLGGHREDMRVAIYHQRHFVVRKALTRFQALSHQPDV